ncbi:MAG: 6-bladed beta-propeller, partial [Myxococcales bacterium]|nr:6-bladed beta-propeller [Myxococcales bacterium]
MQGFRHSLHRAAAALILGACAACASCATAPRAWNEPGAELVWPEPPERARIAYVGAIRSPADLGVGSGWLDRLAAAVFGAEQARMVRPIAVAVNGAGVLVVADPSVPTVHWFDLENRAYRQLGSNLAAPLRSPVGVAIDSGGRVYVADSALGRVFVLDARDQLVAELGEGLLERPTGLALDSAEEHLYVVDTIKCRVFVFDRAGRRAGEFGRRGVGPGEFNAPTSIAVSPDGTLSVSDSLNFRVQRFAADGAPLGLFGQLGDGTGNFTRPKGVAADTAGRL